MRGATLACVMLSATVLWGCAHQPEVQMVWIRADGARVSTNPSLQSQFELDRTACEGEMQRANMSGTQYCRGLADCMVAGAIRGNQMQQVGKGCMADRGYLQVTREEAEARFAAIETQRQSPATPPVVAPRTKGKPVTMRPPPPVAATQSVAPAAYVPPVPPEPQLSEADRTLLDRNMDPQPEYRQ
jgi:hypothetical protein